MLRAPKAATSRTNSRIKARHGYLRAAVAIAHKILRAVYTMLSTGAEYRDLGAAYLDVIDANRVTDLPPRPWTFGLCRKRGDL